MLITPFPPLLEGPDSWLAPCVFAVLRRVYIYLQVGVAFLGRPPTHPLYKGHPFAPPVPFHVSCFLAWTEHECVLEHFYLYSVAKQCRSIPISARGLARWASLFCALLRILKSRHSHRLLSYLVYWEAAIARVILCLFHPSKSLLPKTSASRVVSAIR